MGANVKNSVGESRWRELCLCLVHPFEPSDRGMQTYIWQPLAAVLDLQTTLQRYQVSTLGVACIKLLERGLNSTGTGNYRLGISLVVNAPGRYGALKMFKLLPVKQC